MDNSATKIGYVGLGTMGGGIAANLARRGFTLKVWNRTPGKAQPLAAVGAQVADSLASLAKASPDAVFLNLSDGAAVRDVLFGEGGLAPLLVRGCIVVDNSTIGPGEAQVIAGKLARLDLGFVDAPVSGGRKGAADGTLSIMVGGEAAAFDRVRPMLEATGSKVTHLGGVGMGQACKACNQIAVICNLLGVCEAAALAKKLGLDVEQMIAVVGAGAGASRQLDNYARKIFSGDMTPNFAVRLMLKDLGIIRATADQTRLPLNGTAVAESYLRAVATSAKATSRCQTPRSLRTLRSRNSSSLTSTTRVSNSSSTP
jgi:3-hydroxyisobutyrate dehydrogenase-like beta-hydroxyacid dehydrogenase